MGLAQFLEEIVIPEHLRDQLKAHVAEKEVAEKRLLLETKILHSLNGSESNEDAVRDILKIIQEHTGIEAVGIRLRAKKDFPYLVTSGFPAEFVEKESSLCARDSSERATFDSRGRPSLECLCGMVISGSGDTSKPYFTANGSFWTNSTTELLGREMSAEDQRGLRGRCHKEGYESVALIPLRYDSGIVGLLQLNDHRRNLFTAESIRFYEGLGESVGVALRRNHLSEELTIKEMKYSSLFDNLSSGAAYCEMEFDGKGKPVDFMYLDVNKAFTQITGLVGVVGRRVTEAIPDVKKLNPEIFELYGEVARTGVPVRFEMYFEPIQKTLAVSVSSPEQGRFVATFDDITERKRTDAKLQQTLTELAAINSEHTHFIESLPVTVWRLDIDSDGKVAKSFISPRADERLGLPRGTISERFETYLAHVHPDDVQGLQENMADGVRTLARDTSADYRLIGEDGKVIEVRTIASVYPSENGRFTAYGTTIDVTERKRLERVIAENESRVAIGRFATQWAHDSGNTVGAANHLLELAMSVKDPMKANEYVRMAQTIILDLAAQAQEVQQFAGTGKRQLERTIISIDGLLDGFIEQTESELLRKTAGTGQHITLEKRYEGSGYVSINPSALRNALLNMVTNSIQAMPNGGTIEFRTSVHENEVIVQVKDDGTGMDAETRNRAFESGYSTKGPGFGRGLGMTSVKETVEAYDGRISLESEVGKGTTIQLHFPYHAQPSQGYEPKAKTTVSKRGINVLVVDDDDSNGTLTAMLLENRGFAVDFANSAKKAVEMLKSRTGERQYQLIISDDHMPPKSGWDLAVEVKRDYPGTRVIIASGAVDERVTREVLEAKGVSHYVLKSLPIEKLERVICETIAPSVP